MSGINELKNKTKMSLDELYEKPANSGIKQTQAEAPSQPTKAHLKPEDMPIVTTIGQMSNPSQAHVADYTLKTLTSAQPQAIVVTTPSQEEQDNEYEFVASRKRKEPPLTYKMTFNLSKEIYKAFNDLYAKRMMEGRKTEKSEMAEQAIRLLIQHDNEFM